jgi:outer membrane protein OmpA-like peptidoglycan-associated protein
VTNKAVLLQRSYAVLDDVARQLKRRPDLRVEIQGHTDLRHRPLY